MHCMNLFDHDLNAYLSEMFSPKKLLVYLHIPKCSGTSSVEALKKCLPDTFHFAYDNIDLYWDRFVGSARNGRFDLTAGHFDYEHLDNLRKNEVEFRAFTFIRHPIDRLISEYRYMCTQVHPDSEQFRDAFPSFESFVETRVPPNAMAKRLLGGVRSIDEYIDGLTRNYAFIGVSEFYHLSMTILLQAIGKEYEPVPPQNVTVPNDRNRFEISHKTYQRLEQTQSLDLLAYEEIYKKYAILSDKFIGEQLAVKSAIKQPIENCA